MRILRTVYGRVGLAVVAVGAAALALYEFGPAPLPPPTGSPERPNVLLIVWDTVRADRLSCYGYGAPTTPLLDEFATQSALYERAVAPAMWTIPSHASLFTGLPVSAHGVNAYHKWLNRDCTTLAESFKQADYDTYFFSANPRVGTMGNFVQGFDKVEFPWDSAWMGGVIELLGEKIVPRDRSNLLTRWWNEKKRSPAEIRDLGSAYIKDAGPVIRRAFEGWLDHRDSSNPFFAYLNLMEAHDPRIPSEQSRRSVMSPQQVEQSYRLDQSHDLQMAHMLGRRLFTGNDLQALSAVYDASLVELDLATHEILRGLERRGMLDNTVVVITSDHGENLGDHGLVGHRYSVHESLLRIPLIVRFPPRVPAGRVAELTPMLDVYATLLDLAGLDQPPATAPHSISLLADPQVRAARRVLVSEMIAPTPSALMTASQRYPDLDWTPWMRWFRAVYLGDLKLIRSSDGRHELYDLGADPNETDNLYPQDPQRAEPLLEALDDWVGSFEHYDHRAKRIEGARPHTPAEMRRLRALGYAN